MHSAFMPKNQMNEKKMTKNELDRACVEYSKNRERTKELVHEASVRRELGEMEKELYRRCRERRAARQEQH